MHRAAKESALVSRLIESGELFHPLAWSAKEAYTFLREIPIYEQSGILCRIPDWWKRGASSLQVNISLGGRQPSAVGMDAVLDFDIELHLSGERISYEEAKRLIDASEGLALIKNRWVAVDHEKLSQTLEAYENASSLARQGGLSFRDALRFELNPKSILDLPDNRFERGRHKRTMDGVCYGSHAPPRSHSASADGRILLKQNCGPISRKEWLGSRSSIPSDSACALPMIWGSVRQCRFWRCCGV